NEPSGVARALGKGDRGAGIRHLSGLLAANGREAERQRAVEKEAGDGFPASTDHARAGAAKDAAGFAAEDHWPSRKSQLTPAAPIRRLTSKDAPERHLLVLSGFKAYSFRRSVLPLAPRHRRSAHSTQARRVSLRGYQAPHEAARTSPLIRIAV